jgi:ribosome-associated heat shock protein Hsp15
VRLDLFLRNSGIIPRRSRAQEACQEGLVSVDSQVAKPATEVRVGQRLRISIGLQVREYEILDLPSVPVPKHKRSDFARLLSQDRVQLDWW